jgi:hypothetical protein
LIATDKQGTGETINNAYSISSTKGKVKFLHAAAGYPTKETWLKAI